MASVTSLKDGKKLVQFEDHKELRRTIRLGRTTMKDAESFGRNVEYLVSARRMGRAVPNEISEWVTGLADTLADKLAGYDLITKRISDVRTVPTLGEFLNGYIADRSESKPRTIINLKQTQKALTGYFGDAKPLDEITPADGEDFRRNLLKRLGINTVRRHCGRCKQFFRYALRKRLIAENPFGDMKDCKVQANRERDYFVSHDECNRLMEVADLEWKAIIALCRYAGLRCPSEVLAIEWRHINWETGRMTVPQPKLEHIDGKKTRIVPLFPKVRQALADAFDAAEPGARFVVGKYRGAEANLRTQLDRISDRAGVVLWPKPFVNMRASLATELTAMFPSHVCADWLGHSEAIADKHYRQVTDAHFQSALAGTSALQGALQTVAELGGKKRKPAEANLVFPEEYRNLNYCTLVNVPLRGVEPRFSD